MTGTVLNEQTLPLTVPTTLALTSLTVGGKAIVGPTTPVAMTPGVNVALGTPNATTQIGNDGTRAFCDGQIVFNAGVVAGTTIATVDASAKPLGNLRMLCRLAGSAVTTFVLVDSATGNITLSANATLADTLNFDSLNWRIV